MPTKIDLEKYISSLTVLSEEDRGDFLEFLKKGEWSEKKLQQLLVLFKKYEKLLQAVEDRANIESNKIIAEHQRKIEDIFRKAKRRVLNKREEEDKGESADELGSILNQIENAKS